LKFWKDSHSNVIDTDSDHHQLQYVHLKFQNE